MRDDRCQPRRRGPGLPCFCTANEHVLRAVLAYAAKTGFPTVIEATCNQVNQEGGYTGMTPRDFMAWLTELSAQAGVPMDQLVLGGDHLGPNPWRKEPVERAMEKAAGTGEALCGGGFHRRSIWMPAWPAAAKPNPTFAQIAERAADLCAVAADIRTRSGKLVYIIGTEVPVPGGETEEPDALDVTSVARFRNTITTHRNAFAARGLDSAWQRIVSVVTQPGVDFGHTSIFPSTRQGAAAERGHHGRRTGLTFEAHSTDYQPTQALRTSCRTISSSSRSAPN